MKIKITDKFELNKAIRDFERVRRVRARKLTQIELLKTVYEFQSTVLLKFLPDRHDWVSLKFKVNVYADKCGYGDDSTIVTIQMIHHRPLVWYVVDIERGYSTKKVELIEYDDSIEQKLLSSARVMIGGWK